MTYFTFRLSKFGGIGRQASSCSRPYHTPRETDRVSACPDFQILGVLMVLCTVLLSGCVSLLPPAPPRAKSVMLMPAFQFPADLSPVTWSLAIEQPLAIDPFDSRRIIVNIETEKGIRALESLANLEWSDRLPALIQQQTISAFEKSGRIIGVGQTDEDFNPRFVLQLHIKTAEIVLTGLAQQDVRINLSAKLITKKHRNVIAQRAFKSLSSVPERTERAFLQAYEQALGQTLADIVAWTLKEGSALSG